MTTVDDPISSVDLFVSPLGRVEGDLDVRVTIDDGVVTSAHTEGRCSADSRSSLRGKDPQAGLIVLPHLRNLWQLAPVQSLLRTRHRVVDTFRRMRPWYAISRRHARRCNRFRATSTPFSPSTW